ncbi:NeuD/PglB/VioB family sugar acetyltransferase [Pseudooceanicola onchidii]|uniref:NeuD/PglB/VioB family sugar acetyltransferase n=1 Tax=Pseudooceanicola onchidii TaxID=2562279 RepID=UPI0010A9A2CB|nr:NeuD/PglB/VioB family sugar acetyltransferase [Pseudooceanicola onchidii]
MTVISSKSQIGIALVGAGGHAAVVLDALRQSGFAGPVAVFDSAPTGRDLLGEPVQKGLPTQDSHPAQNWLVHVAIGDNRTREGAAAALTGRGYGLATIVHPSAIVSSHSNIGVGSCMLARTVVSPRSNIGFGCIVNTGAIVEHDCNVGNWAHISCGAIMTGGCKAGDRTWIGAGAVLRQQSKVCDDVVIGANGTVLNDIEHPGTWVGTPVHRLEGRNET